MNMSRVSRTGLCALLLFVVVTGGCGAPRDEIVVLGMIHGGHRTSEVYGIESLREIVRRVEADYVLCEIPPGRLAIALREYEITGEIAEPRVRVFPEYVDVVIPMGEEMGYVIVPCAAWTREMADARRAKLGEWEITRAEETREVDRAMEGIDERIGALGSGDDPFVIHTDAYDEMVREGMEPYQRLFGDELGAGGWDTINAAHYALIEDALDAHGGEGKRFLITFGAWHKYWIVDRLRERGGVELLDARGFLQ